MERTAIVKKHPERGVWCLFDSKGEKALNCFGNKYKGKKPPDDVIAKAERIVQYYKRMARKVVARARVQTAGKAYVLQRRREYLQQYPHLLGMYARFSGKKLSEIDAHFDTIMIHGVGKKHPEGALHFVAWGKLTDYLCEHMEEALTKLQKPITDEVLKLVDAYALPKPKVNVERQKDCRWFLAIIVTFMWETNVLHVTAKGYPTGDQNPYGIDVSIWQRSGQVYGPAVDKRFKILNKSPGADARELMGEIRKRITKPIKMIVTL